MSFSSGKSDLSRGCRKILVRFAAALMLAGMLCGLSACRVCAGDLSCRTDGLCAAGGTGRKTGMIESGSGAVGDYDGESGVYVYEEPVEETFDQDYFIRRVREAAEYYRTWFFMHACENWDLVSREDVITQMIPEADQECTYYAVIAEGITSRNALREASHEFFSYDVFDRTEDFYKMYLYRDAYIEKDGKLYICEPSGLGKKGEVISASIKAVRVRSDKYRLVIAAEMYYPFSSDVYTLNYIKEGDTWCFDGDLNLPGISWCGSIACTVDSWL